MSNDSKIISKNENYLITDTLDSSSTLGIISKDSEMTGTPDWTLQKEQFGPSGSIDGNDGSEFATSPTRARMWIHDDQSGGPDIGEQVILSQTLENKYFADLNNLSLGVDIYFRLMYDSGSGPSQAEITEIFLDIGINDVYQNLDYHINTGTNHASYDSGWTRTLLSFNMTNAIIKNNNYQTGYNLKVVLKVPSICDERYATAEIDYLRVFCNYSDSDPGHPDPDNLYLPGVSITKDYDFSLGNWDGSNGWTGGVYQYDGGLGSIDEGRNDDFTFYRWDEDWNVEHDPIRYTTLQIQDHASGDSDKGERAYISQTLPTYYFADESNYTFYVEYRYHFYVTAAGGEENCDTKFYIGINNDFKLVDSYTAAGPNAGYDGGWYTNTTTFTMDSGIVNTNNNETDFSLEIRMDCAEIGWDAYARVEVDWVKVYCNYTLTNKPHIDYDNDKSRYYGLAGTQIKWNLNDLTLSGNPRYSVLCNNSLISTNSWIHGTEIIYEVPIYQSIGVYNYSLELFDGTSNFTSRSIRLDIMNPPTNIETPQDIILSYSSTSTLEWNATDETTIIRTYSVKMGSTIVKTGLWNSGENITYSLPSNLGDGIHIFTLETFDGYSNVTSDETSVEIINVLTNIETPLDIILSYGSTSTLEWNATDETTTIRTYSVKMGSTVVKTGSWNSGVNISYSIPDYLSVDIYSFTLETSDGDTNVTSGATSVEITNILSNIEIPQNLILDYGTINQILQWNVTDTSITGILEYSIKMDSDIVKTGSWNPGVNITYEIPQILGIGTYLFTIETSDGYDNVTSPATSIQITNLAPEVEYPTNLVHLYGSGNFTIQWRIVDGSTTGVLDYTLKRNNIAVDTGTWISGDYILYEIPNYESIGTYEYFLEIDDGYEIISSDKVYVQIKNVRPFFRSSPTNSSSKIGTILSWEIKDESVIDGTYDIYVDGIIWRSGVWTSEDNRITIDTTELELGVHTIQVIASDGYDSTTESTILVDIYKPNTMLIIIGVIASIAIALTAIFLIKAKMKSESRTANQIFEKLLAGDASGGSKNSEFFDFESDDKSDDEPKTKFHKTSDNPDETDEFHEIEDTNNEELMDTSDFDEMFDDDLDDEFEIQSKKLDEKLDIEHNLTAEHKNDEVEPQLIIKEKIVNCNGLKDEKTIDEKKDIEKTEEIEKIIEINEDEFADDDVFVTVDPKEQKKMELLKKLKELKDNS